MPLRRRGPAPRGARAARPLARRALLDEAPRHRTGGGIPRAEIHRRLPGLQGSGATLAVGRYTFDRAFHLEGFRDYLALEAGHSSHTVASYLRAGLLLPAPTVSRCDA